MIQTNLKLSQSNIYRQNGPANNFCYQALPLTLESYIGAFYRMRPVSVRDSRFRGNDGLNIAIFSAPAYSQVSPTL